MGINLPHLETKPLKWVGRSKDELLVFPEAVVRFVGHALFEAQVGDKSSSAKPLQGFGGAGVLEVIRDHDGNTFRAVYTVKLAGIVYVLHCFQKKSKTGIKTPQQTIELIRKRLAEATRLHKMENTE